VYALENADLFNILVIPPYDNSANPLYTDGDVELQVLMPVVNAPFRVYWAYNPSSVQTTLNTPIPFSRSAFPNDYSYQQAIQLYAPSYPYNERTSTFRFSVGRTF